MVWLGFLAETLSTDVGKEVEYKLHKLPKIPLYEEERFGTLKHAKVVKVRRLSRKYLLAELELIEPFDIPPGPAQFVMIWLPGIDYMPMSITEYDGSRITIFFSIRGEGTRALANSTGKVVGVVGPLGKALAINAKSSHLLVAGGTGLAPIIRLAKELNDLGLLTAVIWGTRGAEDVGEVPVYFREVTGFELSVCTEDCSVGYCGRATDLVSEVLPKFEGGEVIVAGPNDMLATVADLGIKAGTDPVLILESMVECGLGICGSCILGKTGLRLCRDGPAFRASEVMGYLTKYLLSRSEVE